MSARYEFCCAKHLTPLFRDVQLQLKIYIYYSELLLVAYYAKFSGNNRLEYGLGTRHKFIDIYLLYSKINLDCFCFPFSLESFFNVLWFI